MDDEQKALFNNLNDAIAKVLDYQLGELGKTSPGGLESIARLMLYDAGYFRFTIDTQPLTIAIDFHRRDGLAAPVRLFQTGSDIGKMN